MKRDVERAVSDAIAIEPLDAMRSDVPRYPCVHRKETRALRGKRRLK